jgi:integrase/recombinase XerC
MAVSVQAEDGQPHLFGDWAGISLANEFLAHLRARAFSPATVRAYAYDVANLARFLDEHDEVGLAALAPRDVFAWVDWQGARTPATGGAVVRFAPRGAARRRPRSTAGSRRCGRSSSSW